MVTFKGVYIAGNEKTVDERHQHHIFKIVLLSV